MLLNKVRKNFPFFFVSHALATRYELKNQEDSSSLSFAAITSTDRAWLKQWLTKTKTAKRPETPQDSASTEIVAEGLLNESSTKAKPKKRKVPKDDLIESIRRKDKKEILDSKKQEQIDLIKAFSKREIKLATIKEIETNQNNQNLADSSTTLNDELVSETFAKILLQQSKKAMAIEIYEKLALKFPDKRAYFADLIEKSKE
uniref:hypothetical protein n=1 Tax=Algoriphagus sp. TaxID=1872435 RepID=UPI004047C8D3